MSGKTYIRNMPRPGGGQTVILADGAYPNSNNACAFLRSAQRLICCDGAAANKLPVQMSAIVGDCDSLSNEVAERYADIICCDPDQEYNDLTKAVMYCLRKGFKDLVILGATGKREDHTLGNISLLIDYGLNPDIGSVVMVTDYGVFEPIYGDTSFESFTGQQVSIFCIDPTVEITTGNLMYPLKDANLRGWWQGTLNQALGESFTISTDGPAIIFRSFDGKSP